MVSVNIGAQEGAYGELFKGLGSAFQSQIEANQRGAAAKARLELEKKKFKVQQEALVETKKKNTMNTALRRLKGLMPKGDMFQLKNNAPNVYKALVGQTIQQGFPEMDPKGEVFKTMLMGLLGDGPQVNNIVTFLGAYANKLTAKQRITLVRMVQNDPSALPDAMKQANTWAEAFDEKATLKAVADKLKIPPGGTDTPESRSLAGINAVRTGLEGGVSAKDLSPLLNLGKNMAAREASQIKRELDLNRTVMVQKTPDAAPRSILAKDVGEWLDKNKQGRVFSQQALAGGVGQQLLTKTQVGKARGTRVDMAGLLGSAVQLRKDFARLGPGIAGFRGAFGESLSGILGQISPQLGKMVSKGITGADPAALAKFRADAQAMIAKLIPIFTGEESGRISEPEREIAKKASKALSKGASQAEILGALDSITNGAFLAADRSVVKAEGKPTWGFVQSDGEVSEALWTKHFDRIQKISKMTDARVVNLLNALESQQRSFMATELWAGVEVQ